MEICLKLGRMEEEKAMRLMMEKENRDMRKELQKVKKEDWNQRYWQKETEVITSEMNKLELDEDIGVTIMKEILAGVTEIAEKALEMDMDLDTSHSFEVGIKSNLGVGTWADLDMDMEAAGARETMDI